MLACIAALPQTTIKAIGSSQSIADAGTVVKELIDNALDAAATSIFIEISANALDVIQVKDNGHGIASLSRPLIAKRHCTSKISCQEDLNRIKGRTLGFRGEALSHIAEASFSLTVSTRVDGEETACRLPFNRDGSVGDRQRISHAVGSTVRVEGLFKHYPVRRQRLLKVSTQVIAQIKSLLQAYAFARPTVRFALSILKTANDTDRLVITPTTSGSLLEHARKILGSAAASQCRPLESDHTKVSLQLLLPRVDADPSKLDKLSSHISIDGRPLSTRRGTGKHLIKLVSSMIQNARGDTDAYRTSSVVLRMTTNEMMYDVNIEPAKDDVLFDDMHAVETGIRDLLKGVSYKQTVGHVSHVPIDAVGGRNQAEQGEQGDSSVDPAACSPYQSRSGPGGAMLDMPVIPLHTTSKKSANDTVETPDDEYGKSVSGKKDVTACNPWVLARINARPPLGDLSSSPLSPTFYKRPSLSADDLRMTGDLMAHPSGLLTPEPSSPLREASSPESRIDSARKDKGLNQVAYPTPYSFTPINAFALSQNSSGTSQYPKPSLQRSLNMLQAGTPQSSIPLIPGRGFSSPRKQGTDRVKKRTKAPQMESRDRTADAWFRLPEMERDEVARKQRQAPRRNKDDVTQLYSLNTGATAATNTDIRAFMRTKDTQRSAVPPQSLYPAEEVWQGFKEPITEMQLDNRPSNMAMPTDTGPDKENVPYTKDSIASAQPRSRPVLQEIDLNEMPRDPRAALLRPGTEAGRVTRAKSAMLPLERTPVKDGVQGLQLAVPRFSAAVRGDIDWDESFFADTGDLTAPFPGLWDIRSEDEVSSIILHLRRLLVGHPIGGGAPLIPGFDQIVRSAVQNEDDLLFDLDE